VKGNGLWLAALAVVVGFGSTLAVAVSAEASTPAVDCTASNRSCPEVTIAGDSPATLADGRPSPVHGYADPALRKDPTRDRIWMAYSWPRLTSGAQGRAVTVDNHLAHSDDGGATWTFDRPMWTSSAEVDPVTGRPGFVNNEVVSLEAAKTGDAATWYSVRQRYDTAGGSKPDLRTFVLHVATAPSPTQLADASEQVLGGGLTSPKVVTDVNLSSLSPELKGCVFQDPALHLQHDQLFLAAQCSLYTSAGEDFDHELIAVFATRPQGEAKTWSWRYVGKFGTHTDAVALGGQHLQQTDLETGRDGKLLAIVSPGGKGTGVLGAHIGCRALELTSLDPPRLTRDSKHHPKVVARVQSSDSKADGPGACGYDPASSTGIVIMRRLLGNGQLVGSLRASGLRP